LLGEWPAFGNDPATMKIVTIIVRILLGLVFLVLGSNAFLHFIPMPPMTGHPAEFLGAMAATGYLQAVAALQMLGGLLLIIGVVPLGLLILGPIIVNIDFYHIFLDPSGLGIAAIVSVLALFLLFRYAAAFAGIFRNR
jgi:putative oxidoreductase